MKATPTRTLTLSRPEPRMTVDLTPIVEAVTRRAEEQGHILARQVREELIKANADPRLWNQVLKAAGPVLERRRGHYYFVPTASPRRQHQAVVHQRIHQAVHELVSEYRQVVDQLERREADRITYLTPVRLHIANGESHEVLTKDISSSGLRLLGSRDLLGQKVRVNIPRPDGDNYVFVVRIVWTCRVGDELYENGGMFLEMAEGS